MDNNLSKLYPKLLDRLKEARNNLPYFCNNYLNIITKDGRIAPFILNNIQLDFCQKLRQLQEKKYRKVVVLKARQFGLSTFIEALFFQKILFNQGKRAFVMAHQSQSTGAIFNITNLFYEKLPDYVKQIFPQDTANAREIKIKHTNSSIRIGTAGGEEVGRGLTLNYIHLSEVAFYDKPDLIVASLSEAMGDIGDNIIIYESTANGFNFFREEFEKGLNPDNNIKSLFYGWHQFEDYRRELDITKEQFIESLTEEEINLQRIFKLTLEQINWRRNKIKTDYDGREELFRQEYPIVWQEAFINSVSTPLIEYQKIYEARQNNFKESDFEPLIVGIDPARQGGDRTVITMRRGRKIIQVMTLTNMTSTEIEGYIIHNILNQYNPNMIFVDAGYGLDIVDHIRELGYKKIKAIFFNGKPNNPNKYVNKRSEMHDLCRKWFYQEGGVDIKDNDEIANEYSLIPDLKINSQGKLYMIAKDDIKELNRNRSPDYMDSLILTFAENVAKRENNTPIQGEFYFERRN